MRARWLRGIEWTDDLAGALAVARGAGNLGFEVLEERRWRALARWAAQHPGAGSRGYVGAELPRDQANGKDSCPRRRWRHLEGRE
mmetsp:Transcript_28547/g.63735  ORF Transcript_28547/g.63735 Transcript_28547/m.63735 type:complete len:85 (-) Transcript_28547:65-319(-)